MRFSHSSNFWPKALSVGAVIVLLALATGLPSAAGLQETRIRLEGNTQSLSSKVSPIVEIPLASESQPLGITMGPNGNVWFAENNSTMIVEYTPANQTFRTFVVPTNDTSMIWFMFFDPSGNLWFSNQLQPYLWRFSPATGQFVNFTTGNEFVRPFGLAYDNLTNQIWFTSTYTDQIGYFNLHGENATMGSLINATGTPILQTPPFYGPTGIRIGPNGNIFVSEPFSANIVEYSPTQQKFINVWRLPSGSQPVGIALDNTHSRVWFANHASSLFGYLDEKTGKVVEFSTSPYEFFGDTISLPYWIRITHNGTIWFDEHASNKIARYDPSTGMLTEFAVPTNQSAPLHFVIDNQRSAVWFTEFFGSNLAKLNENSTCQCTVQLSTQNIKLSSSVSFYLKYISPGNQSLTAQSPAPLITGTFQKDGFLTNNLTMSSSVINSSYFKITLTRGTSLAAGNYSITVCPRTTSSDNITFPGPIRQCATSLISVINQTNVFEDTYFLIGVSVVVVVVISAGLALLYLRRKTQRPLSS